MSTSGNNAARGQSAGRRGSLANYTGDSAAPPSRDMVDADAYLAANGTAAPADDQDQGDVAAAAILETQGNDDAGYDAGYDAEQEAAARRGKVRVREGGQAPAVRRAAPPVQAPPSQYPAVRELPWKELPGPGRPRNIAHPADILDRRKVDRVPLHLSVPSALQLDERLRAYVFHNRVDVPGDVVGVALDQYLGQQGY